MKLTDLIHEIPIQDVISEYVSLTKKGTTYKGLCPLHGEKTPSFTVFPATNTYKCFGCLKGGDAISFVMYLKNIDFLEASRIICDDHSITYDHQNNTPPDPSRERRLQLLPVLDAARNFFVANLHSLKNAKALDYALSRWDLQTIKYWDIGYASDSWNELLNHLQSKGYKPLDIVEACLASSSEGKFFDYFRNRITFPFCDAHGKPVTFSGRTINPVDKNNPKYFHGRNSDILFKKGEMFFGLHLASENIRKTKTAILVEGAPDVIRMHSVGAINTISVIGTNITSSQVNWLSKHCSCVTIIGDSDSAGQLSVRLTSELLISAGLFVNVISLPGPEKQDPDSFFKTNDYLTYAKDNTQDYISFYCANKSTGTLSAMQKQDIITHVCSLIFNLPSSSHEVYIEQLSKLVKPKKAWLDEIKRLEKDNAPPAEDTHTLKIPAHVNANDFEKFGFFQSEKHYVFRTKAGLVRGSNFVMEPLFHVESIADAKRLFRITNEYNHTKIIELAQRDLIGLSAFKLRIESLGNFLWEAGELELNKLKRYLYEKTQSCIEIKQLGWQKEGVWSWSNGIYNGSFTKIDEYGIAPYKSFSFYIPAFSSIYANEDSLFVSEKRFYHKPGNVTMKDLLDLFVKVYGTNAWVGYGFLLATCFRDVITNRFTNFPLMNLFGPKGAGKTEMAEAFLQFFGNQRRGPNINNTSKAALADHVAQFSNSLCHIDEYKNNLDFEKIEFLKGLHDGTGRTRMNMERDRKKETSNVDCGVIVTGQEMPTADMALFNRFLFLLFTQTEYNESEKNDFMRLKDLLKAGITHLTHEILNCRSHFIDNFFNDYNIVSSDFLSNLGDHIIEDRTFRNWLLIATAYKTIHSQISTTISYEAFMLLAVDLMKRQNEETKRTSDVAVFWDIFGYLVKEGELTEGVDFKILVRETLPTINNAIAFDGPTSVLYLNHTRVFQKYRKHGAQTRDNVLPIKTLQYYLSNSKEYFGNVNSTSFVLKQGLDSEINSDGKVRRQITSAMAFCYERLRKAYSVSVSVSDVMPDDHTDLPY